MRLTLRAEWEKVRRLYTPGRRRRDPRCHDRRALIARQVGSHDPASSVADGALGLDICALFATALFAVWMYGSESVPGLLARTFTSELYR